MAAVFFRSAKLTKRVAERRFEWLILYTASDIDEWQSTERWLNDRQEKKAEVLDEGIS